jgi:hypothetical protein
MTPSIAILGFNTWGWRMTAVLTGSLLCGLMYLIALRLRRDRFFAIVASLIVCLDGLAFVESRLGLLDIPAIFFTALAWYLFLLHWQARTRRQWRITLYIMAAGLGLAFAAKLTAVAPLAVIAGLVFLRWVAPYAAGAIPALRRLAGRRRHETVLWREAAGSRAWLHYAAALILVAVIFCASWSRYLTIYHDDVYQFVSCNPNVSGLTTAPYPNQVKILQVPVSKVDGITVPNPVQAISNIIAINEASLRYQELECHGHPYASRWYTWPIMEHPVLMYYQSAPLLDAPSFTGTGVITNMGNPAVWWLGILALLFCVWRMMAGAKWFRVCVGALMVASLTTMILTFHAAEPGVDLITGTQPGPIGPVGPLFYLAFRLVDDVGARQQGARPLLLPRSGDADLPRPGPRLRSRRAAPRALLRCRSMVVAGPARLRGSGGGGRRLHLLLPGLDRHPADHSGPADAPLGGRLVGP